MRWHRWWGSCYHLLTYFQWLIGLISAIASGATKAKPTDWSQWPLVSDSLTWLQANAWLWVPTLMFLLAAGQLFRSLIGPPWVWDAVHDLLDRFREDVFENEPGPLHHHRVTLFRHVRFRRRFCRWPWSGWLIPIERSGHTTQRSRTAFLAPDDADRAEGIAGQTWVHRQIITVSNLPDINNNPLDSNLEEYATRGWVSTKWLRRRTRQHARSFCGIPVEVRGKMWGVIVIDSANPTAINEDAAKSYRLTGRYLGKLLERVR